MNRGARELLEVALAFEPGRTLRVGRLAMERGRAALEYDAAFIASGLTINPRFATPARGLVWAEEPRAFDGLHGVFADSLPDAWGRELVRRRVVASGADPSALTGLDRLAIVGRRGMGALVYEPAIASDQTADIDLDALSREAFDLLSGTESDDLRTALDDLADTSGGARPKVLVAIDDRGRLRAGTDAMPPGYAAWIVKFRAPRDRVDSAHLEMTYADLARSAGIDMAPSMLLAGTRAGTSYFATRRFDRTGEGGRVHMLSLAALLELRWEVPSIDYHAAMSAVRLVTRRQRDVEQMFRRAVFNVVANNRDDHAKQHAFLMDARGTWSLAPAYDLNYSAGPGGGHYLSVEGRGAQITGNDLLALAARQSIAASRAVEIVQHVIEAVADFDRRAAEYGATSASRKEIGATLAARAREVRGGLTRRGS